jgi:hypothetical protein
MVVSFGGLTRISHEEFILGIKKQETELKSSDCIKVGRL